MNTGKSATRVNYELRPCKQVERRILLDALHELSEAGFLIRDYEYVGMGSIYFVDYTILHRHFGMRRFISAEMHEQDHRRALFNRPFREIDIRNCKVGDIFATPAVSNRRIVWLDYDGTICLPQLLDVSSACRTSPAGSVVLATFDTTKPKQAEQSNAALEQHYRDELDTSYPTGASSESWEPTNIHRSIADLFIGAAWSGLEGRGLSFEPLFFFVYADGRRMVSLGGMICDTDSRAKLAKCNLLASAYIRRDWSADPFEIKIPKFTRKERFVLDAHMPRESSWLPSDFPMSEEDVGNYASIYRFIPHYSEHYL